MCKIAPHNKALEKIFSITNHLNCSTLKVEFKLNSNQDFSIIKFSKIKVRNKLTSSKYAFLKNLKILQRFNPFLKHLSLKVLPLCSAASCYFWEVSKHLIATGNRVEMK